MFVVNEKTYGKLVGQIDETKMVPWDMRTNLLVHPIINELFLEDKFVKTICFDKTFKLSGVGKQISKTEIGKLPTFYPNLDHFYGVMLNENNIRLYDNLGYLVKGIFNFPYIKFKDALEIADETGNLWITYIINPYLMNYSGSIGMFFCLNTDHIEDTINDINGYVRKHTGYDLFYKPTNASDVNEIVEDYPDVSLKKFVDMHILDEPEDENHKGWNKLLRFWSENECVKCSELDNAVSYHYDNVGYIMWGIDWDLKTIDSSKKFIMVDNNTGEELGPFNHFELDLSYNCIYTGNHQQFELTPEQVNKFRKGVYDFRIVE